MYAAKPRSVVLGLASLTLVPALIGQSPAQNAAPSSSPAAPPPNAVTPAPASVPSSTNAISQAAVSAIAYDTEPLPNDPQAALLLASKANGLGGAGMQPFYLKAHYQTFDAQGKPAAKGVFELYWAAGNRYRISYDSNQFQQVLYHTADGDYRAGSSKRVPYADGMIWGRFMHPAAGERALPKSQDQPMNNVVMRCLSFYNDPYVPSEEYCLEQSRPLLRVSTIAGIKTIFNKIELFQHRFVAADIEIYDDSYHVLTLSLDEVRSMKQEETPLLSPPADALRLPHFTEAPEGSGMFNVKSDVVSNSILTKVQPVYPESAKMRKLQGTVRIAATIGTDGRIHDPAVVHSPDKALSESALTAVSQWRYAPYLVDGKPTEVATIVSVTFTLGLPMKR